MEGQLLFSSNSISKSHYVSHLYTFRLTPFIRNIRTLDQAISVSFQLYVLVFNENIQFIDGEIKAQGFVLKWKACD